jgi:hypothetical protein
MIAPYNEMSRDSKNNVLKSSICFFFYLFLLFDFFFFIIKLFKGKKKVLAGFAIQSSYQRELLFSYHCTFVISKKDKRRFVPVF